MENWSWRPKFPGPISSDRSTIFSHTYRYTLACLVCIVFRRGVALLISALVVMVVLPKISATYFIFTFNLDCLF